MNKVYNIYPRLMRQEGVQKVHHFQNKEINEIAELSNSNEIDLQNYFYSPIGGHKVTQDNLSLLIKALHKLLVLEVK